MTSQIPGLPGRDLLQPLTEEIGAAVHREVERVRDEVTRPYRDSREGVRLLGGSALLGSMAAGGATALLIRLLDRRLPPTASAALVTAALGAGAAALARAGRARMPWAPAGAAPRPGT
ncbi:phage holin family protein [Geodermatophilus sp. SYSU D00684]